MKRIFKFLGFVAIGLAVFFVVLLVASYYLIETGELRRLLVAEFEKQTQWEMSVGETEVELGRVMGFSFRDFVLFDPQDRRPVVRAPKIVVRVALMPLLKRRIVFHEISFYQPVFQLTAGQKDQAPAQGLMAHLLFPKQGDGDQFVLDLRRIRIEQGEAIFPDPLGAKNNNDPGVAHLRGVDATIDRLEPKPGSKAPLKMLEGKPGVEIFVKATVVKQGMTAGLKSKGRIFFADASFDLRRAWWDVHADIVELSSKMLRQGYSLPLLPEGLHGTFGFDLDLQGRLAESVRARVKVDFRQLRVEAPELFPEAVAPADGSLKFDLNWTPREIRFPRLDLQAGEIRLAARGLMRPSGDEDPYLEAEISSPFLPIHAVRQYVPWRALTLSQWEDWIGTIDEGEIKLTGAGLSGRLSEIRSLSAAESGGRIRIETEIRDAGAEPKGDRYLPLREVSGRMVLENGDLYYRLSSGRYGRTRLEEIEGRHKGFLAGREAMELRAKGEADLGELKGQLELPFIPDRAAKLASGVKELGGAGRFELTLRKQGATPYRLEGWLALNNGALRAENLSLTRIQGTISLTPGAMSTDMVSALLEGSPLRLKGVLKQYFSEQASFDVTVESPGVKAGSIMRFFPDAEVVSDAGMVGGVIRYRGSLASANDRNLTGSLQLRGVRLPVKLFDHTVDQVDGDVRLGDKEIHFREIKGRVIESAFAFDGRLSYAETPQLTFAFNAPELDLGRLLSDSDGGPNELYDRLQAEGKVNIDKGQYEGFEFSELKTDLTLDKRLWRLENFFARSGKGTVEGVAAFMDKPETLEFSMEPKVQGVPIGEFLNLFDIGKREITGYVDLAGKLESKGSDRTERKRNLTGSFHLEIKDGVARRMRLLVRILNIMDLTRWFSLQLPDLNQKGIRFHSITGDFKVDQGVYSTQNFIVDSDDISITGAGKFDGPNEVIDAVVAIRPFPRVGSAVSYIPLIGPGIAGIKDSILVASFRVKGPVDDPTIAPAPLSTLSEFFFGALKIPQKLIPIPGKEEK